MTPALTIPLPTTSKTPDLPRHVWMSAPVLTTSSGSTPLVLGVGHRFYMERVDTNNIATQVIEMQPIGDGANQLLVESPVGGGCFIVDPDNTVAPLGGGPRPSPAITLKLPPGDETHRNILGNAQK